MFVLIERQNHCTLSEALGEDFPKVFKSRDYLEGFCAGRFFGKWRIGDDEDIQESWNALGSSLIAKYWIRPVYIEYAEENDAE